MTRTNEPDFFLPERGALCAVSGGLDSMCLLTMAVQWGQAQGRRVAAAHFNHQLRGGDADRDERFVRDWCAAHAIPFFAGRGDVRAKAEREGLSVEEAARTLREYVLQVRELFQAEIDIRQNRIMKTLAIVTTIFLPLSLVAGWNGMNFVDMLRLRWRYGYPAVTRHTKRN